MSKRRRETTGAGYIESTYDAAGQVVYYKQHGGAGRDQIKWYYSGDARIFNDSAALQQAIECRQPSQHMRFPKKS